MPITLPAWIRRRCTFVWSTWPLWLEPHNFNHAYMGLYWSLGAKGLEQTQLKTQRWYGTEMHPQQVFVAKVKR